MKNLLITGEAGSRLWTAIVTFTKKLLPVYDKPMVYYPLTTLMFTSIKNILIITTREDLIS